MAKSSNNSRSAITEFNTVIQGDCIRVLNSLTPGSVDLIFADPPFNIGYDYDIYNDKKQANEYLTWSKTWMAACYKTLKSDGSFWLAIGDDYSAELKLLAKEIGFYPRSWVIWYYTFGVNCVNKFTRSHTHLHYFVKNPKQFTFNASSLENRIPSARLTVYNDSRGNPDGRLPDDTWILRPQDLQDCFTPDEDTWYIPRVNGTFKEREGFHGCQMPEQLLGRIIKLCSHPDELVVDPFSGSATTVTVAKKLGRRHLGIDLSPEYVKHGLKRLENTILGEPLEGSPEPVMSALKTFKKSGKVPKKNKASSDNEILFPNYEIAKLRSEIEFLANDKLLKEEFINVFTKAADGYSIDRLVADPVINSRFEEMCLAKGLPGHITSWNRYLFNLRKKGALSHIKTTRQTNIDWLSCDHLLYATEIALGYFLDKQSLTLDDILCDPMLARAFDAEAQKYLPKPIDSLTNRWAALKLRKEAKTAKLIASQELAVPKKFKSYFSKSKSIDLYTAMNTQLINTPAVYQIHNGDSEKPVYVGETLELHNRIVNQFSSSSLSSFYGKDLMLKFFTLESATPKILLACQVKLITNYKPMPELNLKNLWATSGKS